MSIERSRLRDDLVAVIAAGRELSPEHDDVLADVFLDRIRRDAMPPPQPVPFYEDPRRLRMLLGAACLALAAMLIPLLGLYAGDAGASAGGPAFVQRSDDPDRYYLRSDPWWQDNGSQSGIQSP